MIEEIEDDEGPAMIEDEYAGKFLLAHLLNCNFEIGYAENVGGVGRYSLDDAETAIGVSCAVGSIALRTCIEAFLSQVTMNNFSHAIITKLGGRRC